MMSLIMQLGRLLQYAAPLAAILLLSLSQSSTYYRYCLADNPTAIVPPYAGPDPGYIVAESQGGLANRLRVLAAYMYVGEYKFSGAHLAFVWDVNDACPGHYLSLFQPLSTVVFATNASRYVLDKHAKIVYENSMAVFTWTMQMNGIPKNRFGQPSWSQVEYNMYRRYKPLRRIQTIVDRYVRKHNLCNASAMHIRTTDLEEMVYAKSKKRFNVESYISFVESTPPNQPVFLMTDSPETQRMFLDRFSHRKILVFSRIPDRRLQRPINESMGSIGMDEEGSPSQNSSIRIAGTTSRGTSSLSPLLPPDHRFTTLEHTLIDVLIAAHAKQFKPAMYSSLSDLVALFSRIGKDERHYCSSKF